MQNTYYTRNKKITAFNGTNTNDIIFSDLSEESFDLELTHPLGGIASFDQVIDSPRSGYKQFVYEGYRNPWYLDPCQNDDNLVEIDVWRLL